MHSHLRICGLSRQMPHIVVRSYTHQAHIPTQETYTKGPVSARRGAAARKEPLRGCHTFSSFSSGRWCKTETRRTSGESQAQCDCGRRDVLGITRWTASSTFVGIEDEGDRNVYFAAKFGDLEVANRTRVQCKAESAGARSGRPPVTLTAQGHF